MASTAKPFLKRRWPAVLVMFILLAGASLFGAGTREAAKADMRPAVDVDFSLWPSRKPLANTLAYREAHGLVPSAANKLRVGGVLLHFPAGEAPNPHTSDRIVRGQADSVDIHLDLSDWVVPKPRVVSGADGLVRVEIRARGFEDVGRREESLAPSHWKAVRERPELGMREYVEPSGFGGWGYLVYASADPRWRTPKGSPIVFDCVGVAGQEPSQCRTSYAHPRGPFISYYVSRKLLPRWRDVQAEVVRRVDSFIVR